MIHLCLNRELSILIILIICSQISFSQKAIFVSPEGNDANLGIATLPLKSLSAALSLSRKSKIKTIILRGGKYFGVSIQLLRADSGLIIKNYTNENPILYGGIRITKLYKENKFICADLPLNQYGQDFRMILVNDTIRERSRLPEKGFFEHQSKWNVNLTQVGWEREPTKTDLSSLIYNPHDVKLWLNDSTNAELTVLHQWDESYLGVSSVDTIQHLIHFTYPAIQVPGSFDKKEYIVWNTMQGISRQGQWYFNKRIRKLYYLPKDGENLTNTEIIIPVKRNIFDFTFGTTSITLSGLTIKASGNILQNENFGASWIDASITGDGTSHITLNKLNISNSEGGGIKLFGDNNYISETNINGLGGGGIYYSGNNVKIENCTINQTGLIFNGAVGIFSNKGIHDSIVDCKISNIPYSAICINGDSCLIENCNIKHAMTFFQDGAAIYFGAVKNSVIRNNFIVGNNTSRFVMGIYFDSKSSYCEAKNNIVVNSDIPVHCDIANYILYENNVFFDKNQQQINYWSSNNIVLNNNLFIAPSILFHGTTINDVKVDTLTIDLKLRKFANSTGLSSFRNNLILNISGKNEVATNQKLPLINQQLLSGNLINSLDKSDFIDFKKLINNKTTKKFINIKKLKLNKNRISEISIEMNK